MLDSICLGDYLLISANNFSTQNGIINRWQSRPLGTTGNFTDILNPLGDRYFMPLFSPTEFRVVDSCLSSGMTNVSNVLQIKTPPMPSVDYIGFTPSGNGLIFKAYGAKNVTSYHWYFGDSSSDFSNASPLHFYSKTGTYTVILVVGAAQCGYYPDSATVNVFAQASVGNLHQEAGITIFPNPSAGIFTLQGASLQNNGSAIIIDVMGRQVKQAVITASKTQIDLSDQPNGVYFVQLVSGGETRPLKLLVSR
jgi:hypothetical protein